MQSVEEGIRVESHPVFGSCAVAATDFCEGQTVLKERPLMLVPQSSESLPGRLSKGSTDPKYTRLAIAFVRATPALRTAVLEELYVPDASILSDHQDTQAYKVRAHRHLCLNAEYHHLTPRKHTMYAWYPRVAAGT